MLTSCGGASDPIASAPDPAIATTVELSSGSLTFPSLRTSQQLSATVRDQRGALMSGVTVTWSSSDAAVATVDASGLVTAVANGVANVTARAGGVAGSAVVTVAQTASALSVSHASVRLSTVGESIALSATARDAAGQEVRSAPVLWSSGADSIATVSSAGVVRAVANGTAIISVRSGALTQTVPVVVAQVVATLTVSAPSLRFSSLGESSDIIAVARDAGGTTVRSPIVQWTSSDSTVARVVGGRITSVNNGNTAVQLRSDSASATIAVTVAQLPVTVEIAGANSRTMALGDTTRLSANVYDANRQLVRNTAVTWTSSDTMVATVNASGFVTARRAGAATMTARAGSVAAATPVSLLVANFRVESIPASLSTPAPGALWEIPVVIIRYIPTLDGVNVDQSETIIGGTITNLVRRVEALEPRIKFMLEEGSKFRGYQNAQAPYSLGYRVVHIVTVFAHFQRGKEVPWNPGHYFPDYQQILTQVNAQSWVNDRGVKEFWVWGYHSANFEQPESNMSSPFTGDISNSSRFLDDLPVYRHTYTVYGYNYARTQAEAVHNHGHQLEALLGHIDRGLFWRDFVGRDALDTRFVTGRAGWTHMPPNTTTDYDYLNNTIVQSDIASWAPGGGTQAPVSLSTWASIPYAWPTTRMPGETSIAQQAESQWYMYWMQNMPGRGNTIAHGSGAMTNWWRFTGDWDGAIAAGVRLSTAPQTFIKVRNDFVGEIGLNTGHVLKSGEVATIPASGPLSVSVWECPPSVSCRWDPYVLQPGQSYAVMADTSSPTAGLKIAPVPPIP